MSLSIPMSYLRKIYRFILKERKFGPIFKISYFLFKKVDSVIAKVKLLYFLFHFTYSKCVLSCVKFQVAGWYAIGKIKQYAKLIIESITLKFNHLPCIISIFIQLSNIILKLKNMLLKKIKKG